MCWRRARRSLHRRRRPGIAAAEAVRWCALGTSSKGTAGGAPAPSRGLIMLSRSTGIPANYKTLFLQGGATLQFAIVPMNFLPEGRTADYVNTGEWSKKAIKEARL